MKPALHPFGIFWFPIGFNFALNFKIKIMKTNYLTPILATSFLVLTFFFLNKSIFGQEIKKPSHKQITVTGSAEMSIDPDEVEISIMIQSPRTDFQKREDDFIEICKKYKIPENQLSFKNTTDWSYWNYWSLWWYYRNSSELSQTYKIKVSAKTNLLDFVKDLNKSWVHNISVTTTSNKDIQTYRKEVKKEAIRMAKEKATYLLEAIDEKIGSVISIEEVIAENKSNNHNGYNPYNGWYWNNPYYGHSNNSNSNSNSNMNSNSVMPSSNSANANTEDDKIEGLSKIKLRYEVKTVFEIK